MSKQHSELDTRLTPSKTNKEKQKLSNLLLEQTYKALEYYRQVKKDALQQSKQKFLQKVNITKGSKPLRNSSKLIKKSQREKPFRRISGYKESSSQQEQPDQKPEKTHQQKVVEVLSSESQEDNQSKKDQRQKNNQEQVREQKPRQKYQILPVHQALLQFQQIIDNFLDYQFVHRKKNSLQLSQMYDFLKTSKFSLNCQKYFSYLNKYNPELYEISDKRIFCKQISGQDIKSRVGQTKKNMGLIRIKQLMI